MKRYDHDEVRCEVMAEADAYELLPGSARTCCVCIEHNCEEAKQERLKHPEVKESCEVKARVNTENGDTVFPRVGMLCRNEAKDRLVEILSVSEYLVGVQDTDTGHSYFARGEELTLMHTPFLQGDTLEFKVDTFGASGRDWHTFVWNGKKPVPGPCIIRHYDPALRDHSEYKA